MKIRYEMLDLAVRGTSRKHSEKYTFYCFADATLVVTLVLPSGTEVEIMNFRVLNWTLKLVNGVFRIDAFTKYVDEQGETQHVPTCFPQSGLCRKRITAAMRTAYVAYRATQRSAPSAPEQGATDDLQIVA